MAAIELERGWWWQLVGETADIMDCIMFVMAAGYFIRIRKWHPAPVCLVGFLLTIPFHIHESLMGASWWIALFLAAMFCDPLRWCDRHGWHGKLTCMSCALNHEHGN